MSPSEVTITVNGKDIKLPKTLKLYGQELIMKPRFCVDGKPVVVLTVEEAKRLVDHLRLCEVSVNDPFYASDCDAWALDLSCRIEQAEVGK